MDSSKIGSEADSDDCAEPEMLTSDSSSSEDDNRRNNGGAQNKMKLRSFRLSRLSSLRSYARPMKSPSSKCASLISGDAASPHQSTPVVMSDSSPSHSNATSTSDARNDSLQKSVGLSSKPMRSLAKISSMKFTRHLIRKSSEGTDLKKTRSSMPASLGSSRSSTSEEHAQCDQLSVSGFERATLRPRRSSTKTASTKSKRSSMKKSSEHAKISDPTMVKATCSSTLKDAKFPQSAEIQSEGISAIKVCSYSYCSLHGHHHGDHGALPPLKRFVSMRRRSLKTPKSIQPESRSVPTVKRSRSRRTGTQKSQVVLNGDSADKETAQARRLKSSGTEKILKGKFKRADGHGNESMNAGDSENLTGKLLGKTLTSTPRIQPRDSKQCDRLSFKHDGVISNSSEEASVNAKVYKEFNGDTISYSNMEGFKGNCELSREVSEASTVNRVTNEEKPEDFERDNDLDKGISLSRDSVPNTNDQSHKSHIGKQKYLGLWGLVHRHMASGIATEDDMELARDGKDKAEQVTEGRKMPQMSDYVSPGTADSVGTGDHNAGNQKIGIWQSDVIKLVQDAFDKILSEVPDQSCDDQSLTPEGTSERELSENNQCEGGQCISSYHNCSKQCTIQDPEKPQLEGDNINVTKEEKAAPKAGNKSNQDISKNWSNLKKVIILNRFVKALEKVKKFNHHKPLILPIEVDPETEKVRLRHQTVEERRNADEWMLDYALQQVISQLAPAQKRKVGLLVQAFETITPIPEKCTHPKLNATASSLSTPIQLCNDDYSVQRSGSDSRLFHITSNPEMSIGDAADQVSNFPSTEGHIPGTCSQLHERHKGFSCSDTTVGPLASETTPRNIMDKEELTVTCKIVRGENNSILADGQPGLSDESSTNFDEPELSDKPSSNPDNSNTYADRNVHMNVSNEVLMAYDSKFYGCDIQISSKKLSSDNLLDAAAKQSWQPESLGPENFMELTAVNGMAEESKAEKQKYTRLLYLLYKHMVSGSTEAGTPSIIQDAEREQASDGNAIRQMKNAHLCEDISQMNQKLVIDNEKLSCEIREWNQIEAIKIIEEAIDEIPLQDIQDGSLDDSPTDDINLRRGLQKEHSEDGELFIYPSTDSSNDSIIQSNTTEMENDERIDAAESKSVSKSSNKSNPRVLKNWSNLKKVILLKRFISSVEKVRKFNPREPRYLPLEPDQGGENVHLRHQNMEARKNYDKWMLDHALQQVVAKLTPERKRKVELLVEAFETVAPMFEVQAGPPQIHKCLRQSKEHQKQQLVRKTSEERQSLHNFLE